MNSILATDLFEVRPFKAGDAALLASWMSDSPKELFLLSSSLTFPVKAETLIERTEKADPEEHRFYSVFLAETGRHVGHFEIKNINTRHRIGTGAHIVLSPEYRGKGIGRQFIDLISEVAFTKLDLHRLSLSVHTVNLAAIAAYRKAGYFSEGLLREVLLFDGKRYSLYQMSLLRSEWKEC